MHTVKSSAEGVGYIVLLAFLLLDFGLLGCVLREREVDVTGEDDVGGDDGGKGGIGRVSCSSVTSLDDDMRP